MNIGIDGNEANLTHRVGVGQYAFNILTNLYQLDKINHYYIYLKDQPLSDLPKPRDNWHYRVFGPQKLWTRLALPFHLYTDGLKLDFFYSPSHYSPHFSPFPTIPTIHDLGYLSTSDQFTKKDLYQLTGWTKHSLQHASGGVAVSQFTKNEITRIYGINPDKITVVPNGVGDIPKITPKASSDTLAKFKITQQYFLYLGTLKPSKNLPILISAFARYLQNHKTSEVLVIAGKKGWLFEEIFNTVKKENIQNSVIFTDYVTESEKWTLYQNAIATVLPSLYEGFGIPALESQKIGTPVIASNIPAFKEVLENSAIYIDPTNPSSLITAFLEVKNPKIRADLIKNGKMQVRKYTWANSAQLLLDTFNKL
jgi:glycosyltransferase involved in cell wall biosynthesis